MFGVDRNDGSLFNMGGRFFWSSNLGTSRVWAIYGILSRLGAVMLRTDHSAQNQVFVALTAVILSMYGGGFAAIPSPANLFDETIHGQLITACQPPYSATKR